MARKREGDRERNELAAAAAMEDNASASGPPLIL